MHSTTQRLRISLLILRLSVALVLLMWTIDKFLRPAHAGKVLEHFYSVGGVGHAPIYVVAGLEVILITLFVLGLFKTWTYGLVLLFHAATTVVSLSPVPAPLRRRESAVLRCLADACRVYRAIPVA